MARLGNSTSCGELWRNTWPSASIVPQSGLRRIIRAEAEEGETGRFEDGPADSEGRRHDHGGNRVGQQMPDDQPPPCRADGPGGDDVVPLPLRDQHPAVSRATPGNAGQRDGNHDRHVAGAEKGGHRNGQQETRQGEGHINQAHQQRLEPAAQVSGGGADGDAGQRADADRGDADQE